LIRCFTTSLRAAEAKALEKRQERSQLSVRAPTAPPSRTTLHVSPLDDARPVDAQALAPLALTGALVALAGAAALARPDTSQTAPSAPFVPSAQQPIPSSVPSAQMEPTNRTEPPTLSLSSSLAAPISVAKEDTPKASGSVTRAVEPLSSNSRSEDSFLEEAAAAVVAAEAERRALAASPAQLARLSSPDVPPASLSAPTDKPPASGVGAESAERSVERAVERAAAPRAARRRGRGDRSDGPRVSL